MKRAFLVFLIALFPLTLLAQRHRATPTPSPTPISKGPVEKNGMVCRTKQQDLELRDWIAGIMDRAHKAEAENAAAQKTNLKLLTVDLPAAKKAATDLANECAADKACAAAPLSCWFHRLIKHIFWIAGAVVGLIILLLAINIISGGALAPILSIFASTWSWVLGLFTRKPKPPL